MNGVGHIYCINLDSRPDRLKLFDEEAKKGGFQYERIMGVEGGAPGATLSHLYTCMMAKEENFGNHAVFEDDAVFSPHFNAVFAKAFSELPAEWDILFLGGNYGLYARYSENLLRIKNSMCFHAMVINKRFYDIFIETLSKTKFPCDVAMDKIYKNHDIFAVYPAIAWQRHGYSDIENKKVNYDSLLKQKLNI